MDLTDAAGALQTYFPWAPAWLVSLILVAAALAVALGAYQLILRLVRHGLSSRDEFWRALLLRTKGPARLALVILALAWAVDAAPFTPGQAQAVRHGLLMAFIVLCGWAVMTGVNIAASLYMRRFRVDLPDNLLARKHATQIRILQRTAAILVVVVTAAMALMTVPGVRQIGVSLLAAGGAAGIIVGLALQPILSNLMAGFQIAFAQPIRIDDAVVVEGQFGHVEEINATYVVIRLWDLRRLVVPLKTFLEKPFENWTRESSDLLGEVLLSVDYRVPIAALRDQLQAILMASSAWDRKTGKLQVKDSMESFMVIRCLVSASNAPALNDLRFEVRERMIDFLQQEFPQALPRKGIEFAAAAEPGPAKQKAPDRSGAFASSSGSSAS
ncbi:MAG: Small-conductance mechanosensitive channel [Caulobacteraceae bacterium]|nr:Small-conductance mechanosensitive channel [Caulobacteraceae bacterium]